MKKHKYLAFISYSHEDAEVVRDLQKRIEKYKIPRYIAEEFNEGKRYIAENRLIYSTETSMNIKNDIWSEIEKNLDDSEYMIIICSEHLPKSDYCSLERKYFRKNHDPEKMICIFIGDNPDTSIPYDMRSNRPAGTVIGRYDKEEIEALPRYCNYFHPDKKVRQMEFGMLMSRLLKCDYDIFADRVKEYNRKRLLYFLSATSVLFFIALAYFIFSNVQINKYYRQALINQAKNMALQSEEALAGDDRINAVHYALEALPYTNKDVPVTNHARLALEQAVGAYVIPDTEAFSPYFTYTMDNNVLVYAAYYNEKTNTPYVGIVDRLDNLEVWNSSERKIVLSDYDKTDYYLDIAFCNQYFLALTAKKLYCYDLEQCRLLWISEGEFIGHRTNHTPVTGGKYLFPDESGFLYVGAPLGMYKFDLKDGKGALIQLFSFPGYEISNITLSPNGKSVAYVKTGFEKCEMHVFDAASNIDVVILTSAKKILESYFDSNNKLYVVYDPDPSAQYMGDWLLSPRKEITSIDYKIICFNEKLDEVWSDSITSISGDSFYFFEALESDKKLNTDIIGIGFNNRIIFRDMLSGKQLKEVRLGGNIASLYADTVSNSVLICTDSGDIERYEIEKDTCEVVATLNGDISNAVLFGENCYVLRESSNKKIILYSSNVADPSWQTFSNVESVCFRSSDTGIVPVKEGFLDINGTIAFYDTRNNKVQWTNEVDPIHDSKVFLGLSNDNRKAIFAVRNIFEENGKTAVVTLDIKTGKSTELILPEDSNFAPEDASVRIIKHYCWYKGKLYFIYQNTDTLHYYCVCFNSRPLFGEKVYTVCDITQYTGTEEQYFIDINVDEDEQFLSFVAHNSEDDKVTSVIILDLHSQYVTKLEPNVTGSISWNNKKKVFYTFSENSVYVYRCESVIELINTIPVTGEILEVTSDSNDNLLVFVNNGGSLSLNKYSYFTGDYISSIHLSSEFSSTTNYSWIASNKESDLIYFTFFGTFDYYMLEIDTDLMEIRSKIPGATSFNEEEQCFFSRRSTGVWEYGQEIKEIGHFKKHSLVELYEMAENLSGKNITSNSIDKTGAQVLREYTLLSAESKAPEEPKEGKPIEHVNIIVDNIDTYMPDLVPATGKKFIDTTGYDSLILKKDNTLWYFGRDSEFPVQIMTDVKDFSLSLDSDTYGTNEPAALILCNDGTVYGCGVSFYGSLGTDHKGNKILDKGYISFLKPEMIAENIREIYRGYRFSLALDNSGYLHVWSADIQVNQYPLNLKDDGNGIYIGDKTLLEYLGESVQDYTNINFVMSDTFQQSDYLSFYIAVMTDGSVWSCHIPDSKEGDYYSSSDMRMGDGTSELKEKPVKIFDAGTCW